MKYGYIFCMTLLLGIVGVLSVGAEPIGIFDDHQDVGEPDIPGLAELNDGIYTVDAVGSTIGYRSTSDQFHFAFKEMTGNFAIMAEPFAVDNIGRGGVMVRQSLDADAVHASLLLTSGAAARGTNSAENSVYPTFRSLKGGATKTDGDPEPGGLTEDHVGPLRLERIGNSFYFYTMNTDGDWVQIRSEVVPMTDPVLVGLAATAENGTLLGLYDFEGVEIEEFPLSVNRTLPTDEYEPGADLSPVTLTASVRAGDVANATVNEMLPVGAVASNIEASAGEVAENPDGSFDWILTDLSGEATLTYDLQLGQNRTAVWQGTFTDGVHPSSFIGGNTILPAEISFPSPADFIDIHPIIPTMFQVEDGEPLGDGDWGLMIDPRTSNGFTAMSMNTSSSAVIEFPINIPESGTYYLFGLVRGEDGNSDSFHFEIDGFPAGDNSTRWNINSNHQYERGWVSSEDPDLDIRPFELEAGEHFIYLGNREDDASIDWLVMTTNPDINIDGFNDEVEQVFVVERVLPDLEGDLPASIDVSVILTMKSGADRDIVVNEIPPAGWEVSGLSTTVGTAQQEEGMIVWTAGDSGTLSYTLAPAEDEPIGVFNGEGIDQLNGFVLSIVGDIVVPSVVDFQLRTEPIEIGSETVFFQAENPHFAAEGFEVQADASIPSKLYAIAVDSGRSGGILEGNELTFELNVLQTGTYYLIAQTRGEGGNSDSFYVDFDVDFNGLAEDHSFGYQVPNAGVYERRWYQLIEPGGNLWDTTGEPRPFELSAGEHSLHWHSRETDAKVDWIAITTDPTIDLESLVEPGEKVSINDFMLY